MKKSIYRFLVNRVPAIRRKYQEERKKCSYPRFQAPSDRKTFSMESGILFFRRKRARGGHWVSGKDKTSFS